MCVPIVLQLFWARCCYRSLAVQPRRTEKAAKGRKFWRCERPEPLRSGLGLVSRVTPVQTAMRNCTRDECRPFEVGNQVLISSHRKLLSSKAMVVNVAEKSEQDFDRHD